MSNTSPSIKAVRDAIVAIKMQSLIIKEAFRNASDVEKRQILELTTQIADSNTIIPGVRNPALAELHEGSNVMTPTQSPSAPAAATPATSNPYAGRFNINADIFVPPNTQGGRRRKSRRANRKSRRANRK